MARAKHGHLPDRYRHRMRVRRLLALLPRVHAPLPHGAVALSAHGARTGAILTQTSRQDESRTTLASTPYSCKHMSQTCYGHTGQGASIFDAVADGTMKIHLLGTGTPTPALARICSGHLIDVGDDGRARPCFWIASANARARRAVDVDRPSVPEPPSLRPSRRPRTPLILTRWDQGREKIAELDLFGSVATRQDEKTRTASCAG